MSFENQIVWITGASSGIGAALAIELARKGAILVLSARREDRLHEVRAECVSTEKHLVLPLDVTDTGSHEGAFREIMARFGRVDVLVNNAGIGQRGTILRSNLDVERHIMDVNFFGAISITRRVLPHMVERNAGLIVVMSSVMGKLSTPGHATYAASKHALHGYFDGLRSELYKTGIGVSIICPGYIQTDISKHSIRPDGSKHGRMDKQHIDAMTAETMARKTVRALEKGRQEYYVGGPEIYGVWLQRLMPGLVRRLLPKVLSGR